MKSISLSVVIIVFASLSQRVFARGFETESILKLNASQVQKISDYLIDSGRGQISLTNESASPVLSMGKITVNGLTYDLGTSLQNLGLDSGYLVATFGQIDSIIRIESMTYNDTIVLDADGITGRFSVSFHCKNISVRLTANHAVVGLSDINTAQLDYSVLKANDLKVESCSGLNDAAQMLASTQAELIKELQDPKFFNEVYKPKLMPLLVSTLMRTEYTSKIGEKTIRVKPRDMKVENGYLYMSSDIHIPDPSHAEVHDYRVNQVNKGINISKPFIFSLFNDVAFKGQKILVIPSSQVPGLDDINNSWFMKLFVLSELLRYPSSKLHVEVQQVSDQQFYVALMATNGSGVHRVIAAYMNLNINLDGYVNDKQDFLTSVQVVRGSSRFGFFTDYFIEYVNDQMNAYRSNIFDNLQIPGLSDLDIRINLVD